MQGAAAAARANSSRMLLMTPSRYPELREELPNAADDQRNSASVRQTPRKHAFAHSGTGEEHGPTVDCAPRKIVGLVVAQVSRKCETPFTGEAILRRRSEIGHIVVALIAGADFRGADNPRHDVPLIRMRTHRGYDVIETQPDQAGVSEIGRSSTVYLLDGPDDHAFVERDRDPQVGRGDQGRRQQSFGGDGDADDGASCREVRCRLSVADARLVSRTIGAIPRDAAPLHSECSPLEVVLEGNDPVARRNGDDQRLGRLSFKGLLDLRCDGCRDGDRDQGRSRVVLDGPGPDRRHFASVVVSILRRQIKFGVVAPVLCCSILAMPSGQAAEAGGHLVGVLLGVVETGHHTRSTERATVTGTGSV